MRSDANLRALVVDDDEGFLRILAAAAGRAGFLAETADSAAAARARFAAGSGRFDLLVFDHVLPDGLGADLIGELRSGRAIPALLVSGDPSAAAAARAVAPPVAFLPKPFRADAFARVVESLRPAASQDPPAVP